MDKEDIRRKALEDTKEELREDVDRDRLMVKAVKFLDQTTCDFTDEMDRFRDWYALHFPELEKEIQDDEQLVNILSRGIERDNLEAFSEMAESSTGTELTEEDLEMLEKAFETVKKKEDIREDLEDYVERIAEEEMENMEALLGPLLTARLVALAGSLEEIAKKPSSTVQMLGAEKALFRHLKGQGSAPKHGILFEHRYVNNLSEDQRGKMARFLANKTVMAARLDQYGDKFKGDELRGECEEKFQELKD
ncbi:MAG: NOP58 family protein [Nanohaloarchaea archaeon]|nr:NOP58 family protein [Candidatus Nanohaloarchaea archaeon]